LSVEVRAHVREPLIPYRGGKVYATAELTCGPTIARALRLLQRTCSPHAHHGVKSATVSSLMIDGSDCSVFALETM
jgi:hypothetical protein